MFEEGNIIYKIIVASFVMPVLLSGGLLWFFITYNKKKNEYKLSLKDEELKRHKLLLEKEQALTAERTRIAAEMHDDLGGGLTTIKFLSQKAIRKIDDNKVKSQMQKIVDNAQTLVSNISEIIWAMNAGFDTLDNLVAYVRRYAFEFLEDHEISLIYKIKGETKGITLTGEQRRNIFLVIKEALNNTVKHAQADKVDIIYDMNRDLDIIISDNGIGITDKNIPGNGINNIKKRITLLGGEVSFNSNNGAMIEITIPIQKSDNQLTNTPKS